MRVSSLTNVEGPFNQPPLYSDLGPPGPRGGVSPQLGTGRSRPGVTAAPPDAPPSPLRLPGNSGAPDPAPGRLGASSSALGLAATRRPFSRGAQGADLKAIGWETETKLRLPPRQLLPQNRKIISANATPHHDAPVRGTKAVPIGLLPPTRSPGTGG